MLNKKQDFLIYDLNCANEFNSTIILIHKYL